MVVVEHGTAIEATTISLDTTFTLTIVNSKLAENYAISASLQFAQLLIIVEVMLKGPTS